MSGLPVSYTHLDVYKRQIEDVLEEIVAKIPAPEGDPDAPLQALIIDSWFDNYLGCLLYTS